MFWRMMYYRDDREFTNFVHDKLAKKYIYPRLNWKVQDMNILMMNNVDINNAVDYFAIDGNSNRIVTVQERFRDKKYSAYNDFTIRYKREYSSKEERKYSEYFKLNSDYFVYGIINQEKIRVDANAEFIKIAVIDVKELYKLIDLGLIIIDENSISKYCKIDNNRLICPVITNVDFSSSFVPFDIQLIKKMFSKEVILYSYGF